MKHIIFLFNVLLITSIYAQGGRGGGGQGGQRNGGGQQQQQQREEMPDFDAAQMAGIFSYDSGEAIKKIKIKKDESLELKVRRAIARYNTRMDEISMVNTENFDTLNVSMNAMRKQMRPSRNSGGNQGGVGQGRGNNSQTRGRDLENDDPMRKYMEATKQKIEIVKEKVLIEEELLNTQLEVIFSDKQYKKWLKYQTKIKKENAPVERSQNQNQRGGGMRGGGQGGPPGGGGNRF